MGKKGKKKFDKLDARFIIFYKMEVCYEFQKLYSLSLVRNALRR